MHVTPAGACRSQKEFYTLNSTAAGKRIMFPKVGKNKRETLVGLYFFGRPFLFKKINKKITTKTKKGKQRKVHHHSTLV